MPATSFHCNWCREQIGTYREANNPAGAFDPVEGAPHALAHHLRTGTVARVESGIIVAYPCPRCERNNLLQLPPDDGGA